MTTMEINFADIPNGLRFRENLKKGVVDPWRRNDPRRPGAILLFGPPGTGKTTIARLLCGKLSAQTTRFAAGPEWRIVRLAPADFAREGMDRIVASAERIFRLLRDVRRCVVLLDEMEEFLQTRSPAGEMISRIVTAALLPLLDEVVNRREAILVVATNLVGTVDAAVTRPGRFDLVLPLGPPDYDRRRSFFKSFFDEQLQRRERPRTGGPANVDDLKQRAADSIGEDASQWDRAYSVLRDMVAYYTMGYCMEELRTIFKDILKALNDSNRDWAGRERGQLWVELWKIRTSKVPVAMSGAAGASWRVFQEEVRRYARFAPGGELRPSDETYWDQPEIPPPPPPPPPVTP